jgi:putative DNA primase/helicase
MRAARIAAALGGARRSGRWWSCRYPAHDDRSPSLSLRDGDRGLIAHCWAGCNPRDVLAVLRSQRLILGPSNGTPRAEESQSGHSADAARRIGWARQIWNRTRDARGTPVVAYLAERGITIAPLPSLRYAPSLRRPDSTTGPAIVARIASIDGELIGVHRTWLDRTQDGRWRRRDRAMLGRAAGGAVWLAEPADGLMVGEGIESCLAAMQATGHPAWAALSTSGLRSLELPKDVHDVIVLADGDEAGEAAARDSALRWKREGRRVRIARPPQGLDFNDMLLRRVPRTEECAQ